MLKPIKQIRIIFMGTSEFAVPILNKLQEIFDVCLVVTMPDKPAGRELKLQASPVKVYSLKNSLEVYQPEKIKGQPEVIRKITDCGADLIVVASYGKILPAEILHLLPVGCLNIHPSLLPKYRGASPIQAALLNGETTTGISIIKMSEGMDDGDLVYQEEFVVSAADNYQTLEAKLAERAAEIICRVVPDYLANKLLLRPQNHDLATYCTKITSDMSQIKWAEAATQIYNKIRALQGWETPFTTIEQKKLFIKESRVIDKASLSGEIGLVVKLNDSSGTHIVVNCGVGALELLAVQLEGKKALAIKDFVNGQQKFIGSVLK